MNIECCAVRVSLEILDRFLELPDNAQIVAVLQDQTDHAHFSASIVIIGVSELRAEGSAVKYVPLGSIV